MILRFLETIGILYCILSYLGCAYVLWSNWDKQDEVFDKRVTKGERIFAAAVFLILAPLMVLDVFLERLRGGRGGIG
jgi:hypothetical protein